MFEPDPEHAPLLAQKYEDQQGRVEVIQSALGAQTGRAEMNIFRHRGLSGVLKPDPKSIWFSVANVEQGDVTGTYQTEITTIDEFGATSGIAVDFLKCDTEGTELEVLRGAAGQLSSSILGVYSEVSFGAVFEGDSFFGEVDDYLRGHGFILLSLDVQGRGSPVNKYYTNGNFGVLEAADAIWIRPFEWIANQVGWNAREKVFAHLKLAVFSFNHDVTDVAVQHLLEASNNYTAALRELIDSSLFTCTRNLTQNLFKRLDEHMAFSTEELNQTFESIFGSPRKLLNEFYEDPSLNPD